MSAAESSTRRDAAEASITIDGVQHEFPVRKGTLGPDVIDIGALYQDTGHFTYDPGLSSTASCESKISFIDGEKGVLLYRGYPIDRLAEQSNFVETCYLLFYGQLPTREEYQEFRRRLVNHTMVNEQMTRFYTGFRRDAHPMAVMIGVVGALSAFYHNSTDISDPLQREIASIRMIAKMPTIAAMAYKYSIGGPLSIRETISITLRTFCTCALRCHARNTKSIQCSHVQWIASSFCMQSMGKTLLPLQ